MPQVAKIQLDTSGMRDYARFLQQAPEITREEMSVSVEAALLLLEREIKENTPLGANQLLRASWTHQLRGEEIGEGLGVVGEVFSPLNYALPVELGTKPHFPPIDALRDWAEKKLGIDPTESRSVAFAIAHKIAKRGTQGAKMAERSLSAQSEQVIAIIEAALPRIIARLEAGP